MPPMQTLRNAHSIARLVLVWFALSMGVAVASPLVHSQAMELVCTGAGMMKFVKLGADATVVPERQTTLDCPLCANLAAPPPAVAANTTLVFERALVLLPVEVASLSSLLRGPWQARAPPVFPELLFS